MHGRNAVLSSANDKANARANDKEEPPMRRRDLLALSLAALPMALRPAAAQSKYPERPIRLVIPFPPGGVYDAVGRPWADRVKPTLGTVVVENIGGAGGALGAAAVARAPSDGYTLLLGGGGALVLTPIASSRPPFDPVRDFEPIALLVTTGLAIVVHPALPAKTLAELIDYARSNPGKLSYGSAGVGLDEPAHRRTVQVAQRRHRHRACALQGLLLQVHRRTFSKRFQ